MDFHHDGSCFRMRHDNRLLAKESRRYPFYYGTWDAGLKPYDGRVRSETVTFTKDSVLTKQVIQRGEVAMPSDVYKVISQNTDGTIEIEYLGHPHPVKSTLKRGKTVRSFGRYTEKQNNDKNKTGGEDAHEK